MSSQEARAHYKPSGGIAAGRFLLALFGLAAAGFTAGLILEVLMTCLLYVGVLLALVGALAVGGIVSLGVQSGHCRNRLVASLTGVMVGMFAYLSFFHIDHCWRRNGTWSDVGSLPDYIEFRMQTDEMIWHGKGFEVRPAPAGQVANAQMPGQQRWNWLNFAVEAGLFAFLPLYFGYRAAGRPYSERGKRWLERAQIVCPPQTIPELLEALRRGVLANWVKRPLPLLAPNAPRGKISVWYCPAQPDEEPEWLAYLSVGELKHLRLEPEEAAALLPIFPGLLELAMPETERRATPQTSPADRSAANIEQVPEPYAGRLLTRANAAIANTLVFGHQLIPLLLLFAHLGTVALVAQFVGNGLLVALYALGGIIAAVLLMRRIMRVSNRFPVNSRYYCWQFRRQLANRPDLLVPFNDPHACFVEVIPRTNWGKAMLESAADMGLLAIDPDRGELRFEGDRERWRIPADAIGGCTIELMPSPIGHDGMYVAILRVHLPAGDWEWPLVPRTGVQGRDHGELAHALAGRIAQLQWQDEEVGA